MKTTIKSVMLTLAALAATGLCSCSSFLKEYSQDLAKVESWKDLDEVLLGDCYMQSSRIYVEGYTVYRDEGDNYDILHLMSDEMKESSEYYKQDSYSYAKGKFAFSTWQQDTGIDEEFKYVGGDNVYWDNTYDKINVANMVISLIDEQPESGADDHANKERVKGEAHFLRAAYYFLLVNLYAKPYAPATASTDKGVPVKLTEYVEDTEFERASVAEVYAQILSDLNVAEQCLQGKGRKSVYHADETAVHLLQSRVYLYMQNWDKAIEYAQKTLNEQNSLLDLHTKNAGENCIYKDSPETIFTMGGYEIAVEFADGSYDDPGYLVSDDMVSLYKDNDLRSTLYIGESYNNAIPNVFIKFNGQENHWGTMADVSSSFLLRTPEAYLTLAEASAYNGDEQTAREALRQFLRTRMETTVDVNESGNSLIQLIRDERAREFLLEGHRWFDLRRYTVNTVYPWSKAIEHVHNYYANSKFDHADYYRLEENDAAYTLPIPREIRSFQNSLGNNERPDRKAFKTE